MRMIHGVVQFAASSLLCPSLFLPMRGSAVSVLRRRALQSSATAPQPAAAACRLFHGAAQPVAAATTSSLQSAVPVTYRAAVAVPHTSNRLLLALLLGSTGLIGGATLLNSSIMSADAAVAPAIAAVTPTTVSHGKHSSPKTKAHGPRVHPSDLAAIDFRTLGACECPPLPERAPKWLQQLAADDGFQYRDIAHLLDTRGHFLFDALSGEKRLSELYYFSEKVVEQPRPVDGEEHPHLAPSLSFIPATEKVQKPVLQADGKPVVPSPPSSPKAAPAPIPAPAPTSSDRNAFSTFTAGPPPPMLTATGPEVRAVFHVGRALCGHRGIVHGGLTAALMDDVSGAATFVAAGGGHFTANLTINYMKPIRADRYLLVRAQAVKQEGRKTYVNISVEDGEGTIFARGTALYVKPKMLPTAVLLSATQ